MAHVIIHHEGQFAVWSTEVDAPLTFGMTEVELEDYVRHYQGQDGVDRLPARLDRARERGTSMMIGEGTLDQLITFNRAGADERHLTKEELIRYFFVDKVDPPETAGIPHHEFIKTLDPEA